VRAVRPQLPDGDFEHVVQSLKEAFDKGDNNEVMQLMNTAFGHENYSLSHLFKDQQREIVNQLLANTWEEIEASFHHEQEIRAFLQSQDLMTVPDWLMHYRNREMPARLEPLAFMGVTDDLTSETRLDEDAFSYIPEPSDGLPYFALSAARDPRPLIIHEGVPGHYFQLAQSWANPNPIRRRYIDSSVNEGIAFYVEELMLQAGLFDFSPRSREIIYNFMRLRALRVEIDIKLAIGEFSIEGMLMESMRRIDEFPQMLEMFPSDSILITRVDTEVDEEEMTRNEKAVLELLDDTKSLRDLIARARLPLFEVYESLKALSEKELIETKEAEPTNQATVDAKAVARKAAARRNPLPFIVASVFFAATMFLGLHGFIKNFEAHRVAVMQSIESNSIARNQVEAQLRWVIEAYRAQYGLYPGSLEVLEESGLASPRLLKMVDLFSFRYQLTPGSTAYTLL